VFPLVNLSVVTEVFLQLLLYDTDISQGSVAATHLRCGGILINDSIVTNFLLILSVKKV